MIIWFFTIPAWVILMIVVLGKCFFDTAGGFLLSLFVWGILFLAVFYLIGGIYHLLKVEGERFEGFVTAVISLVVIIVWLLIYL